MSSLGESELSDRDLIRALKALADPTRFRMVQEIAAAGELTCGQVAEHFEVSQPTISHHLKILSDSGILQRRQEGQQHITFVDRALLDRLVAALPLRLSKRPAQSRSKRPTSKSTG